ncbi:MAG: Uma2 family endonuclease [Acidobacteriota bacterium]|nr:Uma2 family endonuclease [Acidobacteriota bacterium]
MAITAAVSIEEYLSTAYSPDCDFVDDHIEEHTLGERPHNELQREFITYLNTHRKRWGIRVFPEQRVQTRPTRFRVPDVCVTLGKTEELIFRTAPFLCIEILSSEDRMTRVEKRLQEYLDMGVRFVWLENPFNHDAWIYSATGKQQVTDGILRTAAPDILVPLDELFAKAEE